ncbi:MAG TPA: IMP cyclohydrolase [Candidatus Hydrogenedentes bacterium]|nr:IMP cyclohydrolase [Candidatus Hydrogenedentota bacterium]HNT87136.1 IMP cyclohydrolase [Candidatus Hydrogenedentota bacterium]
MQRIRRAILSCHDKTGLVELARLLREFEVELISTSGTLKALQEAGLPAISIAEFTGVPELMDGRVKSLHHKVHAGLLGVRDNKVHVEQLQAHGFAWIDMVVANLHPLEGTVAHPRLTPDEVFEQTDIGGAAMIRSAAKNYRYVTVVVNPERYPRIMHEMRAHDGAVPFATRYRLAQEAFECTAEYDRVLAANFKHTEPPAE